MLWVLPLKPLMTAFRTYPSHLAHRWVWGSEHDSVRRLLPGLPGSRAAQQWRAHNHYLNSVWTLHPARAVAAAPCRTPRSLYDPDDHHRIGHTSGMQGIGISLKKTNNQTHRQKDRHISNPICFYFGPSNSLCLKHLRNNSTQLCILTLKIWFSEEGKYWKEHKNQQFSCNRELRDIPGSNVPQ